jgi:hypothetical protein
MQTQQDLLEISKEQKEGYNRYCFKTYILPIKQILLFLVLWTSKDWTSFDFFSRNQLIVDECGSSSFNNIIPTNVTPTPLHNFSQKLDKD